MYLGSDIDKYADNLKLNSIFDNYKARLLAIDYGKRRIGLAISDDLRKLALPLLVFERSKIEADLNIILEIINKNNIKGLVIGKPISNKSVSDLMNNKSIQAVLSFSHLLLDFLKNYNVELPLLLYDERYSSVAAQKLINLGQEKSKAKKYKPKIDKIAASIFLQEVLDKLAISTK